MVCVVPLRIWCLRKRARRGGEQRSGYSWSGLLTHLLRLAVIYFNNERYREAEPYFKRVTELTADNYKGYSNLGATYLELGRNDWQRTLERDLAR